MSESTVRRGREGSRWINERPNSHEVAEWFKTVRLHAGMDPEKYVGGITLIPGREKGDEIVGRDGDGRPVIAEDVVNLTFTPYMKVETRVAYFHDYARVLAEEWPDGVVTSIKPVPIPNVAPELGLPEGFFPFRSTGPKGEVKMIGARYRVAISTAPKFVKVGIGEAKFEAQSITIVEGIGTKTVPTATKWDVDLNAVEKAETGAIGRALGVAGMLVLPGSGVATAEDMLEAMGPAPAASPESAELPAEAATESKLGDDELRERAAELLGRLEEYPPVLEDFREWARSRGHASLATITSPALKGFVRKLEKALDAAQRDARPEG